MLYSESLFFPFSWYSDRNTREKSKSSHFVFIFEYYNYQKN